MSMLSKRLQPITDQLFLLPGEKKGRFPHSHSILIQTDEILLIDTGCGIDTLRQLRKEYNVNLVINSHTHPDHSSGNWVFPDKPIYVPEEGFATSGNKAALSKRFVGEKLASMWQRFVREEMGFRDQRPTHSYNDQHLFSTGKVTLKPIYTPGHTKDHYCFFEEQEGILFSFDYDLTSFPWYGHQESKLEEFRASVKQLQALPAKMVVSSHRGVITENLEDEWVQFYNKLDERNNRLLSLLSTKHTLDQLVELAPIYGKFPYRATLLRYWEKLMIAKHLEELQKKSLVVQQGRFFQKTE